MHNHNDGQGHDSKMMWLMMLPCLLLPVAFVVFSGRGLGSILGNWQWIASIAVIIGIHIIMMKFMHEHKADESFAQNEKRL